MISLAMIALSTPARPQASPVPVLLELFTSEGCSSCPPADRLLEALDRQPVPGAELIVISEHVDYWNYLGWRDPFSSPVFTAREQRYSERLGESVYTPQLVIDGGVQLVGSDESAVFQAIRRAIAGEKLPLSLSAARSGTNLNLRLERNPGGRAADLYIAVATDRATSHVIRGENGGHTLGHVAVAKSILRIGKWSASEAPARNITIPAQAANTGHDAEKTRIIAFLQDPNSGKILAATQTRL